MELHFRIGNFNESRIVAHDCPSTTKDSLHDDQVVDGVVAVRVQRRDVGAGQDVQGPGGPLLVAIIESLGAAFVIDNQRLEETGTGVHIADCLETNCFNFVSVPLFVNKNNLILHSSGLFLCSICAHKNETDGFSFQL